MTTSLDCEQFLLEKLISILSKSLNCQLYIDSDGGADESSGSVKMSQGEVSVIEKVLQVLINQNDTLFSDIGSKSIRADQNFGIFQGQNSSDADVIIFSDTSAPSYSSVGDGGIISLADNTESSSLPESTGVSKLHKLEIIKVFVLIFVISIILLTTCRMVFQLFIRFRPEKPPLA